MGFFYFKFFLTSILFSLIIGTALVRFNKNNTCRNLELLIYSLGLGPVFTVLLLYYLLLLAPRHAGLFYVISVLGIYGVISFFSVKGFQILENQFKEWIKTVLAAWKSFETGEKLKRIAYWSIVLILLAGFLIIYLGNTLHTPLEHHDALIYGNLGKMYYHQKQITYSRVMKPSSNGFYFQGSSKPSFSLLLTWEMLLNDKQTNQEPEFDLYFRSMSGYYGILFVGMCFFWFFRKNKYLALLGILVLFSSLRFFNMMVNYHLDAYRIFFLVISWIWLAYTLKRKDGFALFLLGVFSGFCAFTHLIGLIVAVFNMLALFIFYEDGLKTRIFKVATVILLIAVLGNIHYLLDMLFGPEAGFITYIAD